MDHTRNNLTRVNDIIQEIDRTLASLKRQAQKAERYRRYRAEIRDLELHVGAHRWLELRARRELAAGRLEEQSNETPRTQGVTDKPRVGGEGGTIHARAARGGTREGAECGL